VIHAVGPVWGNGDEDAKLSAAVVGALRVGDELKLVSISLPALSTGIFGFPKERAASLILSALQGHFSENPGSSLKEVRLVLHDQATVDVFLRIWHDHFDA
jgi:O-acetyl-ADP-ribose deacetylase (regulator of RNase III)